MGNLLASIKPTVVRRAGDQPSDGPNGVLDQSKPRMRSAISPPPTSHSLDSTSGRASLRKFFPPANAAYPAKARDYGTALAGPYPKWSRDGDGSPLGRICPLATKGPAAEHAETDCRPVRRSLAACLL